ncbi:ABC transporter ATP-binding protein [Streptomyces bohaiensis]|uniref:Dipeptide ABC transporter ATP-binding protein n=1 Tax=Streptomyces bohaiensis TaxID=1431344 RepID=A0ABX1C864_9ACTN|nr:dipeptide ABC transporter ATP-binding protein [Streptomyces bohaiensis]NJQ15344.1 dipeptide ABC transporter ATP-binding protein [Streptomyces bohaiensis]
MSKKTAKDTPSEENPPADAAVAADGTGDSPAGGAAATAPETGATEDATSGNGAASGDAGAPAVESESASESASASASVTETPRAEQPAAPVLDKAENVLEVRDLVKHFPITQGIVLRRKVGAVQAVDGISLDLRRGETLGIVGESGCGKSTLAKLLIGLERPTSGSIKVRGQDLTELRGGDLLAARRNIQMVFQDPYTSLNPRMTVGDLIGEPFEIHTDVVPRQGRRQRVQELLELVGLNPDHINRYPHQFSGGQRQRIGIARALALEPEVLLCDEPVSALDVSIQAQVINLLEKLQDELGLSYLFIAHDLSVVRHIADKLGVMYLGRMVEYGNAEEIYEAPTHPYTQALLSAVPVPDPKLRGMRDEIVLEGDVPSPANPPSGCRFRTRCWKAEDVCAEETPLLQVRENSRHASACHFAQERDVVHGAA